jgi:opacity protein-like surface antigen
MRRRNFLLAGAKYLFVGGIAAGAFAATSSLVHADGMAPRGKAAVIEAPAIWSGFYVGTNTGYAWSSIDGALAPQVGAVTPVAGVGAFSVDYDTEFWGLVLGVQHQIGNVVVGVEGNWMSMYVDKPGSTRCPNAANFCTSRVDDILSIGGRLGWTMGHWMPYLSGGYANSSFSFRARTPTSAAVDDGRTRNDGWYVGGGFDMVVAPGWTTGLEYRHYDFDNAGTTTRVAEAASAAPLQPLTQNATVDTLSLRLTYKWDIPGRYAAPPMK